MFADETGTITVPSNSASSGTSLVIEESQTTFTDGGGDGNIPTPAAGQGTAVLYASATLMPAQTITFGGSQTITISAKAPCELFEPHTYIANVFINGTGLNHSELEDGESAPFGSDGKTITFTIDLADSGGIEPQGVYVEIVIVQHT